MYYSTRRRRIVALTVVAWLLGMVLGAVVAMAYVSAQAPHCPTEDSCQVDYRNGEWHVIEVTP